MYVSVPKNYSGIAFANRDVLADMPRPDMPHPPAPIPLAKPQPPDPPKKEEPCRTSAAPPHPCEDCKKQDQNPLTCLLSALRNRGKAGFDTEDFLLIGLIALLLGKDGNEDIILSLAMLLLI